MLGADGWIVKAHRDAPVIAMRARVLSAQELTIRSAPALKMGDGRPNTTLHGLMKAAPVTGSD